MFPVSSLYTFLDSFLMVILSRLLLPVQSDNSLVSVSFLLHCPRLSFQKIFIRLLFWVRALHKIGSSDHFFRVDSPCFHVVDLQSLKTPPE